MMVDREAVAARTSYCARGMDRRVVDVKTASKRPNGLSADHSLQLTTYAMITPGASGLCRLDTAQFATATV
jgi:hypothetical protein